MTETHLARFGGTPTLSYADSARGLGRWPDVTDEDIVAVTSVLRDDREPWGFMHPAVLELQESYSQFVDRDFCLAVSSGTAALHLAVASLNVEAGSEILTPALGFIASATCILHHNCIPVFVDVEPDTFNIDPSRIAERLTDRTRAIVSVDLLGLPADYDRIADAARGLPVIEDAAQSQGAFFGNRRAGSLGDISAVSLMASKNLPACGEGGLITTDSADVAQHILGHASHGMNPWDQSLGDEIRISHQLGFNYRPSPTNAAFACSQLRRLDAYQRQKQENVRTFESIVDGIDFIKTPICPEGMSHAYQMYRISVVPEAIGLNAQQSIHLRDALIFLLRAEGVDCRCWEMKPLPALKLFRERVGYGGGCPWTCRENSPVIYDPAEFPVAQQTIDRSFIISIVRATSNPEFVRQQARAFKKIAANADVLLELTEKIAEQGGFEPWSGVSVHDERRQRSLILRRDSERIPAR